MTWHDMHDQAGVSRLCIMDATTPTCQRHIVPLLYEDLSVPQTPRCRRCVAAYRVAEPGIQAHKSTIHDRHTPSRPHGKITREQTYERGLLVTYISKVDNTLTPATLTTGNMLVVEAPRARPAAPQHCVQTCRSQR